MVNGSHKTFISQLTKQEDVRVNVVDGDGYITFNAIDFDPFKIKFNKGVCDLIIGWDKCGCFESLLVWWDWTKSSRRTIGNEMVIAHHNNNWYSLKVTMGCVVNKQVRLT